MQTMLLLLCLSLLASSATSSTVTWTNGRYETGRTEEVEVGGYLELLCRQVPLYGDSWGPTCQMISPSGAVWTVSQEGVTDQDGNKVDGAVPPEEDVQVCGVVITSVQQEHLGDWRCRQEGEVRVELVISTEQSLLDIRLPETFVPHHYNVLLEPDLVSAGPEIVFGGEVSMNVMALRATNSFTFHADEITPLGVPEVREIRGGNRQLEVGVLVFDFQRTFVHVILKNETFLAGSEYQVYQAFIADIERGNYFTYGFYPQLCSETNGSPRMCWFTQFESTNARNAFPCLDEPALKATFSVSVRRTEEYHARSNMPLIKTEEAPEAGYVVDTFAVSSRMSSYLVAVAVTNYESVSTGDNVTIWASPEDVQAGKADFSSEMAPEIMRYYAEYFSVKYPLPKMDLMYEPKKGGAMENWGLVLFGPRTLLLNADADVEDRWLVINVVAHELAHQWFGNLVTMDWWSQTWLNEGFAVFVSYVGSEHIDPDINAWARFYVREMQRVMKYDESSSYHWAMSDNTTDRGDIERKFGMFTYQKGGSVIRMMESILTRPTFTRGLTSYLNSLAYSAALEDDLFFHLEAAGLEDGTWPPSDPATTQSFAQAMKSWTNQAGLPVVTFSRAAASPLTWTARQEWLLTNQQPEEERRWVVPITSTVLGEKADWENTRPWTFLDSDQTEMELQFAADSGVDSGPVVFNVQGTGYYRVNYDEDNWIGIADALKLNKDLVHPLNRAQIICDVAALAESGHVTAETRDNVLAYIEDETEFGPLYAFQQCVSGFKLEGEKEEILRI